MCVYEDVWGLERRGLAASAFNKVLLSLSGGGRKRKMHTKGQKQERNREEKKEQLPPLPET